MPKKRLIALGVGALLALLAVSLLLHLRRPENSAPGKHVSADSANQDVRTPPPAPSGTTEVQDAISCEELLRQLRSLYRANPVDGEKVETVRNDLLVRQDRTVIAILDLFLKQPDFLLAERAFGQALATLLEELASPAMVARYVEFIPIIDKALSTAASKSHEERAHLIVLEIVATLIARKATEEHALQLVHLYPQLSHSRVRQAVVETLGILYRRLKNPLIRGFLQTVLVSDPDGGVRAIVATELASTGDPALLADFVTQISKLSSSETSLAWEESRALALGILNALSLSDGLSLLEIALRNSKNPLQASEAGAAIAEAFKANRFTPENLPEVLDRLKRTVEPSSQVMYFQALQEIQSKDPRIYDTIKSMEPALLGDDASAAFIHAVATKGPAVDLLAYSKQFLTRTATQEMAGTVAGTLNFYLLRNPENQEVREIMTEYARTGDVKIRLRFIENMRRFTPTSPDLFGDLLSDLAKNDRDPMIRRYAADSLRINSK